MKTLLVLSLGLLATACSIEEIQDEFSAESTIRETIEGKTWSTECLSTGTGGFQKRIASYSNGRYGLTITTYSDICETPTLTIKETGHYQLWGPTADDSIMMKLDRNVSDYTVTPLTTIVTQSYKASSLCGITDWELGVASRVMGTVCSGITMPVFGQPTYDLYSISNETKELRFGNLDSITTGATPMKRPVALATNPKYYRVQ